MQGRPAARRHQHGAAGLDTANPAALLEAACRSGAPAAPARWGRRSVQSSTARAAGGRLAVRRRRWASSCRSHSPPPPVSATPPVQIDQALAASWRRRWPRRCGLRGGRSTCAHPASACRGATRRAASADAPRPAPRWGDQVLEHLGHAGIGERKVAVAPLPALDEDPAGDEPREVLARGGGRRRPRGVRARPPSRPGPSSSAMQNVRARVVREQGGERCEVASLADRVHAVIVQPRSFGARTSVSAYSGRVEMTRAARAPPRSTFDRGRARISGVSGRTASCPSSAAKLPGALRRLLMLRGRAHVRSCASSATPSWGGGDRAPARCKNRLRRSRAARPLSSVAQSVARMRAASRGRPGSPKTCAHANLPVSSPPAQSMRGRFGPGRTIAAAQ